MADIFLKKIPYTVGGHLAHPKHKSNADPRA